MRNNFFKKMGRGRFVLIPIMAAAFLALISYIVMQLWNNILVTIIHVETITFWQSVGIFILCKILFGFGRMGGFGRNKMLFKNHLIERVKDMSPEELARFKDGFGEHRFGRFGKYRSDEGKEDK